MSSLVVGLFDNLYTVENAVAALEGLGISREAIGLVASHSDPALIPAWRSARETETVKGAETGALVGGVTGLLLGLAPIVVPGLGALLAGGWILTTLAGATLGAVAGSFGGALVDLGVEELEAEAYAEALKKGGALVTVKATADQTAAILGLMKELGARETLECATR